jgi:hypothetical protein
MHCASTCNDIDLKEGVLGRQPKDKKFVREIW